jgi:ribosomal protein S19
MKPPFIRLNDYWKGVEAMTDEELFSSENLEKGQAILIPTMLDRSSTIIENLHNKLFNLHTGRGYSRFKALKQMNGLRFGQFVFTKKMGKSIHDSKRNARKREKLRRKITQKKARRSPSSAKTKAKKSKAVKKK